MEYVKSYKYNTLRPCLIDDIESKIKFNMVDGLVFGQWSYLAQVLVVSNGGKEKKAKITDKNIKYCLTLKGLCFNSHAKYFERNKYVYRGTYEELPEELINDSIMFSLFYINNNFSNKGKKNYVMPFTSSELGCSDNVLNVLLNKKISILEDEEKDFDFREWFHAFSFSKESMDLYNAALKIVKWYHNNPAFAEKDYNDSFYDITNAIMGKSEASFREIKKEDDKRTLLRTKTTKGTIGFSKKSISKIITDQQTLSVFNDFFDKRDVLAKKINKLSLESGVLLWDRDNIY